MRHLRNALVVATALCLVAGPAAATKYAGEFMASGGGARALGMGGAFAAVAGDVSSVYWNPAGISGMEKRQALGMHSERFGDLVNYNFGAYAQPTTLLAPKWEAAIGGGIIHLGVDDIVVTNHLSLNDLNGNGQPDLGEQLLDEDGKPVDYSGLPLESDNSFAFLGTFAARTDYGRVGANLKIIYSNNIAGYTSTGIGIDLGYLRRDVFVDRLDFGAKIQDATGTYISWSSGTNEFILPMVKFGGAYTFVSEKMDAALLLAIDMDTYFENRKTASDYWAGNASADVHYGAELQLQERVMVRGGMESSELGRYTAGAGLRVGFIGFDYAYLHHDEFEATHRVSVLADF